MFRQVLAAVSALLVLMAPLAGARAEGAPPRVEFKTSRGTLVFELYPDKAPRTVANFLQYVKSGHYNGTVFHRVIDGFVIQGGGFDEQMHQKPTQPPVVNESSNGLHNERGTLSMARTMDPDSATAQFFINLVDNTPALNPPGRPGYAVFGRVASGMEIVDAIGKTPTGTRGPFRDVPLQPVVVQSARILNP